MQSVKLISSVSMAKLIGHVSSAKLISNVSRAKFISNVSRAKLVSNLCGICTVFRSRGLSSTVVGFVTCAFLQ